MIRISQLKLKVGHTREELFEEIIHQAHGKRPVSWQIVRKSVDARKKPQLFYVYTIDAEFVRDVEPGYVYEVTVSWEYGDAQYWFMTSEIQ